MCQSMVNIQSPTAEIRRGKKRRKKKKEERNRMKIYMVSLLPRATINKSLGPIDERLVQLSVSAKILSTALMTTTNRSNVSLRSTFCSNNFLFSFLQLCRCIVTRGSTISHTRSMQCYISHTCNIDSSP